MEHATPIKKKKNICNKYYAVLQLLTTMYIWNKVLSKMSNSVLINGMWQVNSQAGKNAR
jgi:hypothetical protein